MPERDVYAAEHKLRDEGEEEKLRTHELHQDQVVMEICPTKHKMDVEIKHDQHAFLGEFFPIELNLRCKR